MSWLLPSAVQRFFSDSERNPSANADFAASIKAGDELECVRLLKRYPDTLLQPGSRIRALGFVTSHVIFLDSPLVQEPLKVKPADIDLKREIAEFCGLGGIIPRSDASFWKPDVIIDSRRQSAHIGSTASPLNPDMWAILTILFSSLQQLGLVKDSLVILRQGTTSEIQATRIAIKELVWGLSELRRAQNEPLAHFRKLDELHKISAGILRNFFDADGWYGRTPWVLAMQTLCLAILSFSQAHLGELDPFFLEHSLSLVSLYENDDLGFREPLLHLGTVGLTCAGDMIGSQVMIFSSKDIWSKGPQELYDLRITLQDLMDLWGPGEFIPCQPPHATDPLATEWSCGFAIRGGVIYKPSEGSEKMHWATRTAQYEPRGVPFKMDLTVPMIIGANDLINTRCPTKPDPYYDTVARTNISTSTEELGTWPESWTLREIQCGIQAGQYINAAFNATWVVSDAQTVKQRSLEEVDLDFLDKPWGLLVSLCTGVARRVALREVVAEVMLPMMDVRIGKTTDWKDLTADVINELKKPMFRAWHDNLSIDEQETFGRNVRYVLRKICWTGVNGKIDLVVSCPMRGMTNACIHIPMRKYQGLASVLKDTERSATFACLTNICFTVGPSFTACQRKLQPSWQNQISALVTSVCQYQWSGANKWTKLPQDRLKNQAFYWMGTHGDKRRVTVKTNSLQSSTLEVSNSSMNWRFFRRAWERFEKIRQTPLIELRERSLITEDHAKEVVMMCERDA